MSSKAEKALLAADIQSCRENYSRASPGKDLKILGEILDQMSTISAASTLTKGARSLFVGLTLAMIGIDKEESSGGILGPALSRLVEEVTKGLVLALMPTVTVGEQQLFLRLVKLLTIVALSAATLAEKSEIRVPEEVQKIERQEMHLFQFELTLQLIVGSGMITELLRLVAKTCGAHEKVQQQIAKALALILILLVIKGGKESQRESLRESYQVTLVENIEEPLKQWMVGASDVVETLLRSSRKSAWIDLLASEVEKGKMALERADYQDFLEAAESALLLMKMTPTALQKDLDEVKIFALSLKESIEFGRKEQNSVVTRITQA